MTFISIVVSTCRIFILTGFLWVAGTNAVQSADACGNKIACAARSVVSVLPDWPANAKRSEEPEGSGIFVGDGFLIATADHVLGPAHRVSVRDFEGRIYKAKIVLRDPLSDVALLRIDEAHQVFEYSISPQIAVKACAIGNSFGLDISISCGVVSAVNKSGVGFNQIEDFIQSDASVNPGMSGGALVDGDGKLLGMLSAIFTKGSDANIGVNFSVSALLLRHIVEDFRADRKLDRLVSGLALIPAKRPGQIAGVEVRQVKPDSVEARAGIKIGDLITKVSGNAIRHPARYNAILAMLKTGDSFEFEVIRGDTPFTLTAKFR